MPGEARFSASPHVELIRRMVESRVNDINTIIPGKVTAYNKESGRAKVQPLNKLILNAINEEGINESLEIPAIDNVPVCFFGSPSLNVTHNVKDGDTGLLLVCQRSSDEFKASHLTAADNPGSTTPYAAKDFRKFDINDAMFFPIYFSGDKGFQGIKSKKGVAIETEGGVRIGSDEAGSKVDLKGATTDLVSIVKDQQDQIDKLKQSDRAIAASNPLTQPSLAVVESNNIISTLKNKLTTIQRKLSFTEGSFLSGVTAFFLAKAVEYNPLTGEIIREPPPPAETAPERITVVMRQAVLDIGTGGNRYGWALPGVEGITASNVTDAGGDVDFSPLARFSPVWGNLIGMYFIEGTGSTGSTVSCLFSKEGNVGGFRYITMSVIHPLTNMQSGVIARYDLGTGTAIPRIEDNLYAFSASNVLPDKSNQNLFSSLNNNFTNFFGSEANFEYPVLYLNFEDSDMNRITLNPEDF